VDGVYTADPLLVQIPRHLEQVSYEEMQELAQHGARVLNAQAVEFARQAGIVIYARATSGSDRVTQVTGGPRSRHHAAGVAGLRRLVCVHGDGGGAQLAAMMQVLQEHHTAPLRARLHEGQPVVMLTRENCHDFGALRGRLERAGGLVWFEDELEAASVVGQGLSDDPLNLVRALDLVRALGLPLHSVDTSPLRLTLFLRPGALDRTLQALHHAFVELPAPPDNGG
jgi:aspartate kinase